MKTEIRKAQNGHEVIIDNKVVMWIIGSKKNAEKELEIYKSNYCHCATPTLGINTWTCACGGWFKTKAK